MTTCVIAEAGSCHDGVYEKALGLLHVARDCGADVIKYQYWSSPTRLASRRRAPAYLDIYERYQMPAHWLPRLKAEADRAGLEFMCTVYLPEDIEEVAPYVNRFKVASFEAADQAFLNAHLIYRKEIIVSTGMDAPVPMAYTRLHCVSAYPTPLDQANLAVLRDTFHGFSDHTACIYTGAFAVAAGARIIEAHIKDWSTDRANPDCAAALDPRQFEEYVRLIRLAERMLGNGVKRQMPCEAAMAEYKVIP